MTVFDLEAYLPDSIIPAYEDFKASLLNLLQKVGLSRGSESSGGKLPSIFLINLTRSHLRHTADSSKAWQVYYDAKNELDRMVKDKETKENDIKEIFNINGFGKDGEWKKLDGHCMELDTGESVSFSLIITPLCDAFTDRDVF